MQHKHLSVPPVASISKISAVLRKAHAGCKFVQLLHSFAHLCVLWTVTASIMIPGKHMYTDTYATLAKISLSSFIVKDFHFLLSTFLLLL
jgi:hypothetical protein